MADINCLIQSESHEDNSSHEQVTNQEDNHAHQMKNINNTNDDQFKLNNKEEMMMSLDDVTLMSSDFEEDEDGDEDGNEDGEYDESDMSEDDDEDEDEEDSDKKEDDVPVDDIDCMLEEGIKDYHKVKKRKLDDGEEMEVTPPHEERKKIVLKRRDQDYFEVLPEGWLEVTHFSGMPIYLHKQSRVCTISKPYHLGAGSARKHEIPISGIPCLQYRTQLEKEKKELEEEEKQKQNETENINSTCNGESSSSSIHPVIAKVESVQESKKEKSLHYSAVRKYCERLFEFQTITIRKFKTWADRRKHTQMRKMQQRPSLPEGTKLITCPLPKTSNGNTSGRNFRKEFVMNPAGKSYVCILHEFVQHAERVQPKYVFKELENAATPYSATVMINGMEYGKGFGSSKKQAKSDAARATLEIIIPQLKEITETGNKKQDKSHDLSFFSDIRIEDARVSDLCAKAGQNSPYQILVECLRRNFGMGDTDIQCHVRLVKHQKMEFTMKVNKHTATVTCANKREGKQRAAQEILKLLHSYAKTWGQILDLYGPGSCKTPKEKKEEEQKITELQSSACANRPNYAILNKLKEEMEKLRYEKEKNPPLKKFCPEANSDFPTSTSNLKCVDL